MQGRTAPLPLLRLQQMSPHYHWAKLCHMTFYESVTDERYEIALSLLRLTPEAEAIPLSHMG
jgi:hypothetical protein